MKIKYVADDGTMFDYKNDCIEYEEECDKNKIHILLDKDLKIIKDLWKSSYIYVRDFEKTLNIFKKEAVKYKGIIKEGFYYWDRVSATWKNIEELIKINETAIECYKTAINIMKNKEKELNNELH